MNGTHKRGVALILRYRDIVLSDLDRQYTEDYPKLLLAIRFVVNIIRIWLKRLNIFSCIKKYTTDIRCLNITMRIFEITRKKIETGNNK